MYKKMAAVLTAATIFLSTVSMAYADTPFKDIENNWAKTHIISVYDKGLMTGLAKDSFSPDVVVTKYSAIKSVAKMMGTDIMDLDSIVAKHKSVLDKYNVPSDYRKEVAYALEKQLLQSEFDLSQMSATPNATKLDICIYLGRALGVNDENSKNLPVLIYKDALQIPSLYHKYVAYMIKIGAIDSKGDQEGKFNPSNPATRAMFAKMIDIASNEYVKTNVSTDTSGSSEENIDNQNTGTAINETPSVTGNNGQAGVAPTDNTISDDNNTGVEKTDRGIIDTITYKRGSQPKILLENENKEMVEYTIPEDLMRENIIIDGQLSDVYSLRPGQYVEIRALSGVIDRISTIDVSMPVNTTAIIKEIDGLNGIMYVYVNDKEGISKEKKVYIHNVKVTDLSLNTLTANALSPGQIINLIGTEDLEAITAQIVIINQ
ncbi:S-layer homology domain-containing protein [Lutispora thermophila]|uniref:S-layer homology domain-containing protein n=1 Tax=Lutispora thermophila DSM 19022 TaxID=1122184 RepID=A0A1M6C119_9FIRM|nr:S-layer homology domain-containing protein [Lutispora thermophila]SHI54680.1 S-layer homology domain-containing protein [Lutispora thermophila DSM 19022]